MMRKNKESSSGSNGVLIRAVDAIANILYWGFGSAVLVALLLYVVHPLLTTFVIPPLSVHRGAEHFVEKDFLKYDDGENFDEWLGDLQILEYGEVIDFYHVDHWVKDSLVYGKFCDVFSVDVRLKEETYNTIKMEVQKKDEYRPGGSELDYKLYYTRSAQEEYILAFCDADCVIRCLMITDMDKEDVVGLNLTMYTGLNWKAMGKPN